MSDFLKIGDCIYMAMRETLSIRTVQITENNIKSAMFQIQWDAASFLFHEHAVKYL